MHYVVAVELVERDRNIFIILDPEREANCNKKGMDFRRYLRGMTFVIPNEIWKKNKIGNEGVGIEAEKFIELSRRSEISNYDNIYKLMERITEKQEIEEK